MFKYKLILVKDNAYKIVKDWFFLFIPKIYYDNEDSCRHIYEYYDMIDSKIYYRYVKTEEFNK